MEGGLNVQEYEVIFYDKADGTEPAKDFILSLDSRPTGDPYQRIYQENTEDTAC